MRIDLSNTFNKAIDIILRDIVNGINRGTQFGHRFKPNAPSTIAQKGHDKVLVGEKRSWETESNFIVEKASPAKQEASVTLPEGTEDYALYNQKGTKRGVPSRPWWGISKNAQRVIEPIIDKDLNTIIDYSLQSAGFRKL